MAFTHVVLEIIDEPPVAKTILKAPRKASVQPGPYDFREFIVSLDAPVTVYDLVYLDVPQISLSITSFMDATLVSLMWPHTLMDALGLQALLEAWSLVLAGRAAEVPSILGAREDAASVSAMGRYQNSQLDDGEEELKIAHKRVQGLSLIIFGMRFIWDLFLGRHLRNALRLLAQGSNC